MDVTHQFQEIAVLLAEDGFVTILEQMPVAAMAAVVSCGMSGQQTPHHGGYWNAASAQQEMEMVGNQGPGVTAGIGLFNNSAQTVEEVASITIVGKNSALLDTANDDVVQGAGGV